MVVDFNADETVAFTDRDAMVIGSVVADVSDIFQILTILESRKEKKQRCAGAMLTIFWKAPV